MLCLIQLHVRQLLLQLPLLQRLLLQFYLFAILGLHVLLHVGKVFHVLVDSNQSSML